MQSAIELFVLIFGGQIASGRLGDGAISIGPDSCDADRAIRLEIYKQSERLEAPSGGYSAPSKQTAFWRAGPDRIAMKWI